MNKTFKFKRFTTEEDLFQVWDFLRKEGLLDEQCGQEELNQDIELEVNIKEK